MAQFVSQHQNFRHGVRDEVPQHLGHDGKMVPHVRPLEAVFDRGGLTPEAITEAKAKLTFHGLMEYESGEDLDPTYRMSVFDSEVRSCRTGGRTTERRALVVNVLRASEENGRAYVEIVPAPATIPWANYDEIDDPDKVVEIANHDRRRPGRGHPLRAGEPEPRALAGRAQPGAGVAGGGGHRSRHERPKHVHQGSPDRRSPVIWEEDAENVLVHADGRVTRAMLCIVPDDKFPMHAAGLRLRAVLHHAGRGVPGALPDVQLPDARAADGVHRQVVRREREDRPVRRRWRKSS